MMSAEVLFNMRSIVECNVYRKVRKFSTTLVQTNSPRETKFQLSKAYNCQIESGWYERWEKNGYFKPKKSKDNVYSMLLPPPNVTGTLHLGHALTVTIQDILARWRRMRGHNVLWIPGTDHAGIATQAVVEKTLIQKLGQTRLEMGKTKFLEKVWEWKNTKENRIVHQLRHLGASLDWDREFFTMSDAQREAVAKAVVALWDSGLIYKGESLVNWSCYLQSTISDLEVQHLHISGPTKITVPGYSTRITFGQLTDFAYKFANGEGEIVVSTTRVETMLGDVAVAVHPGDPRYNNLEGIKLKHPFRKKLIPVILDERVDPNFGTGAVKITPAHDQLDFDIAKSHSLPIEFVIGEDGTICMPGNFLGLKRFEAREKITFTLNELGLLRGIRNHEMQLPLCSRSQDVVELLLKPQWFLKCKEMAEKASKAVAEGRLLIEPNLFEKNWFTWLENIRDWCISRQLWWGHQLPLYLCSSNEGSTYIAGVNKEEVIQKAAKVLSGEIKVTRETDVLDTWFSSSLLPFTSLGWAKKDSEMSTFYPLDILVTGHDILFFWVARMVMLGEQLTGELPFKRILLHGIICDSFGRKMSKSLGNIIDPENIIKGVTLKDLKNQVTSSCLEGILSEEETKKALSQLGDLFPDGIPECGTDALRFTLASCKVKSHYINFNVKECYSNKLFCNKIWQACKFTLEWAKKLDVMEHYENSKIPEPESDIDKWILCELLSTVKTVNASLESNNFHVATSALKNFLYSNFCDVYLECSKPILKGESRNRALRTCLTLLVCLNTSVRLLAPFMPYLAEELYYSLPDNKCSTIMHEKFPENFEMEDTRLKDKVSHILDIVGTIRKLKLDNNMKLKDKVQVWIVSKKDFKSLLHIVETLGGCKEVILCENFEPKAKSFFTSTVSNTNVYMAVEESEVIVSSKEKSQKALEMLEVRKKKLEREIIKLVNRREKYGYNKVPEHIQQSHFEKLTRLQAELSRLND